MSSADLPDHVLLHCPGLAGTRVRQLTGITNTESTQLRDAGLVAALMAGYFRHRESMSWSCLRTQGVKQQQAVVTALIEPMLPLGSDGHVGALCRDGPALFEIPSPTGDSPRDAHRFEHTLNTP